MAFRMTKLKAGRTCGRRASYQLNVVRIRLASSWRRKIYELLRCNVTADASSSYVALLMQIKWFSVCHTCCIKQLFVQRRNVGGVFFKDGHIITSRSCRILRSIWRQGSHLLSRYQSRPHDVRPHSTVITLLVTSVTSASAAGDSQQSGSNSKPTSFCHKTIKYWPNFLLFCSFYCLCVRRYVCLCVVFLCVSMGLCLK